MQKIKPIYTQNYRLPTAKVQLNIITFKYIDKNHISSYSIIE